jgi:hypothetical protein
MNEENLYAPESIPSSSRSSGGIVSGGSFGEMAPYSETPTLLTYATRINPNLVIIGGLAIGGIFAFNGLILGLGKANPNNSMLETQKIQAEAYKSMVTATTDSLKTVANQRPGCVALVCIYPDANQQEQPQAQPAQPSPQYPDYPEYYEPPAQSPSSTPIANLASTLVPTNPSTVEFWRYQRYQNNQTYINDWINYCNSVAWQASECIALNSALVQ